VNSFVTFTTVSNQHKILLLFILNSNYGKLGQLCALKLAGIIDLIKMTKYFEALWTSCYSQQRQELTVLHTIPVCKCLCTTRV